MNTRTLIASALALGFLAACSKPEPVVEVPRPVVVFTLAPAQVAPAALDTGDAAGAEPISASAASTSAVAM